MVRERTAAGSNECPDRELRCVSRYGMTLLPDYADIQQLYWRCNHGADFGDADLYVSVFTDDAVLRSSDGQEHIGKDEITGFISRSLAGRTGDTGRRHWNNSWRITPSAEGARGRTYWLLLGVSTGQPTNSRSGYYMRMCTRRPRTGC